MVMNKKISLLFVAVSTAVAAVAGNITPFKAALEKVDQGGEFLSVSTTDNFKQIRLTETPVTLQNIGEVLIPRLQKALGTELVQAQAASSIEAVPGCWVFKNYQYIGKENMRLPSLFSILNIPDKKLDFAALPADTVFAASGDLDIAGIYKLLETEFNSKEDLFKAFFLQIPAVAQQRGIDLNAILKSISGNWKIVIAGTNPGDLLINIDILDKDGQLAAFIRQELKLPADTRNAGIPDLLLPAMVTFSEKMVKLSTPPTNRKVKTTLGETPDFANYISNIGNSGIGYSLINISPQLIAMVKNFIPEQIAPAIPLAPFSALGLLKHDPAGAYSISAANVSGTQMVSVCTTSILSGILIPALNQARDRARANVCMNNLKMIGLGLHTFACDNQDRIPDKNGIAGLQMIVGKSYLSDTKAFECPSRQVQYHGNKLNSDCPYIYIGGIISGSLDKVPRPSQIPLVFEKPNHKQLCPVLFVDGHVEILSIKPAYTNPNQVIGELSKRFKYPPELLDKMLRAVMEN